MIQYCVFTRDPEFVNLANWIREHDIKFEAHLNNIIKFMDFNNYIK